MGELALTEEIKTLGLEKHAEELERDGLTIVPPVVQTPHLDQNPTRTDPQTITRK